MPTGLFLKPGSFFRARHLSQSLAICEFLIHFPNRESDRPADLFFHSAVFLFANSFESFLEYVVEWEIAFKDLFDGPGAKQICIDTDVVGAKSELDLFQAVVVGMTVELD